MSSEMDKFILQYQVEFKDAVQRLEQLNEKVQNVNEGAKKGTEGFVDFSKKATDEVGKLIPGVEKVTVAVRAMGGEFAIAAVAISALAIGVKSVIELRAQYGAQRLAGMETGVSGLRMEEYQRKFIKTSGGTVNRDTTQEQVKNLSERLQAAYSDPTRMGTEARTFRLLGVNVGERGKGQTGFNEAFGQLATRFSQMRPDQVQGVAKAIGMNQDFALTLQKIGPSIGKVTEMTAAEVQSRQGAEASMQKFNTELAKFEEQMTRLERSLGEKLIPAFTALITLINKIVDAIPGEKDMRHVGGKNGKGGVDAIHAGDVAGRYAGGMLGPLGAIYGVGSWAGKMFGKKPDKVKNADDRLPTTQPTSVLGKTAKGTAATSLDDVVAAMDKNNETSVRTSSDMQMAINMFSGAVTTFANAIDERQAWAAWAGEAGRAAGLSAPVAIGGAGQGAVSRAVGATSFDPIFEQAAKKHGVSVDLLKRIAMTESSMNPNAVGSLTSDGTRAEGLGQIMPANKKALGITNSFDPEQNINGIGKLMKENLDRTGGNVRDALMMYHGGTNKKNWGVLTNAYPDKVLGDVGMGGGGGESRQDIKRRLVQQNIAARLGVPLTQLQQGDVNKGDVSWAAQQMKAGVSNNIFDLQKQLMNQMLPQSSRSRIMNELREQQTGLQQLNQYSPAIEDKARPGERSITIGENAILININGVEDPKAMGKMLDDHLSGSLGDIVNQASTAIKY